MSVQVVGVVQALLGGAGMIPTFGETPSGASEAALPAVGAHAEGGAAAVANQQPVALSNVEVEVLRRKSKNALAMGSTP